MQPVVRSLADLDSKTPVHAFRRRGAEYVEACRLEKTQGTMKSASSSEKLIALQMPGPKHSRALVLAALGVGQILGWGSSYYLPAVLAKPIAQDTGWGGGRGGGGGLVGCLAVPLLPPPR